MLPFAINDLMGSKQRSLIATDITKENLLMEVLNHSWTSLSKVLNLSKHQFTGNAEERNTLKVPQRCNQPKFQTQNPTRHMTQKALVFQQVKIMKEKRNRLKSLKTILKRWTNYCTVQIYLYLSSAHWGYNHGNAKHSLGSDAIKEILLNV